MELNGPVGSVRTEYVRTYISIVVYMYAYLYDEILSKHLQV